MDPRDSPGAPKEIQNKPGWFPDRLQRAQEGVQEDPGWTEGGAKGAQRETKGSSRSPKVIKMEAQEIPK